MGSWQSAKPLPPVMKLEKVQPMTSLSSAETAGSEASTQLRVRGDRQNRSAQPIVTCSGQREAMPELGPAVEPSVRPKPASAQKPV